MTVSITVPLSKKTLLDMDRVASEAMKVAQRRIEQECKKYIPVDTGRLRDSFEVDVSGDGVSLSWTAPYAYDVDRGALPHKIEPVSSEALRFTVDGKTVFAKEVSHPGFEGADFVRKVVQQARQIVVEEVEAAVKRLS